MIAADVIKAAAILFCQDAAELRSKSRRAVLVPARFALYAVMRQRGQSYPWIGRQLGGRDHTTVIYGARKAMEWASLDPDYAAKIAQLVALIAPLKETACKDSLPVPVSTLTEQKDLITVDDPEYTEKRINAALAQISKHVTVVWTGMPEEEGTVSFQVIDGDDEIGLLVEDRSDGELEIFRVLGPRHYGACGGSRTYDGLAKLLVAEVTELRKVVS